ncbi:putative NAD(P)-binding dehydrogenase, putative saccharopine dehydrogenase [Magnetofaba australis IT-1]|uniref:Putative NAD(P)-binding dehydrogenase, putative saccharopine dehydrogenase n=2 Tax=Magnetofaba TaxID=1472292 RepID=A0A1Y2K342_9PROT|nr:putative NAD(P)-binding dehydrogenase, putative saccharopine dehydrogenase [Magnetofaba australis IT-1]
MISRVAGLPKAGVDVPVEIHFQPDGKGSERWRRRFDTRRYGSVMQAGGGRDAGLLIEHFGPFDLLFRLTPEPKGLAWSLVGWKLLKIPLPGWSRPVIECLESGEGERFFFDIDVAFPVVGHVTHYSGWVIKSP